jgi:hypothetical protein
VAIEALALLPIYMALLETQFVGAIEEFAAQWQKSLGGGDEHEHGDWEDVKVLERVC